MKKDNWVGGGISWLWGLPETHPFQKAFAAHDRLVDESLDTAWDYADYLDHNQRRQLMANIPLTRSEVDRLFLNMMLSLANGSLRLKAQAYLFYALATAWAKTVRRKEK